MRPTCSNCGKAVSNKKYKLCPSCAHIGWTNNNKYDESASMEGSEWYKMYRAVQHHKNIDKSLLDTEATVKYFLEHYTPEDFKDNYLMKQDNDLPFSTTNYVLTPTRLRGLARKAEGCISSFIGVSGKVDKRSGIMRYFASFKGKYIRGSSSTDEAISAAVRDEHIISLGLQDTFRLNFKD